MRAGEAHQDETHAEIREALAAYALDAVDPQEALDIAAHLTTCPPCRAEADAHRNIAARLEELHPRSRPRRAKAPTPSPTRPTSRLAVALLLAAAAGHAAAASHHLDPGHGGIAAAGAFLALAGAQTYLAIRLATRPTTRARHTAAALSLALIAGWTLSRTSGLPLGPHSGGPEPVGVLDAAVVAAQIGVLAMLVRARWLVAALVVILAGGITTAALAAPAEPSPQSTTVSHEGSHHHP